MKKVHIFLMAACLSILLLSVTKDFIILVNPVPAFLNTSAAKILFVIVPKLVAERLAFLKDRLVVSPNFLAFLPMRLNCLDCSSLALKICSCFFPMPSNRCSAALSASLASSPIFSKRAMFSSRPFIICSLFLKFFKL